MRLLIRVWSLVLTAIAAAVLIGFASSANSATSLEVTGRILYIDDEADLLTLGNGQTFDLAGSASRLSLTEGLCITISYKFVDGRKVIMGITDQVGNLRHSVRATQKGGCAEILQPGGTSPSIKVAPRRWRFRERPLSGESRGKMIKPPSD